MAAPLGLINITNVSDHLIPIPYGTIAKGLNISDIEFNSAGTLHIQSRQSVEIEQVRIDIGQIIQLANKKLIQYTTR